MARIHGPGPQVMSLIPANLKAAAGGYLSTRSWAWTGSAYHDAADMTVWTTIPAFFVSGHLKRLTLQIASRWQQYGSRCVGDAAAVVLRWRGGVAADNGY